MEMSNGPLRERDSSTPSLPGTSTKELGGQRTPTRPHQPTMRPLILWLLGAVGMLLSGFGLRFVPGPNWVSVPWSQVNRPVAAVSAAGGLHSGSPIATTAPTTAATADTMDPVAPAAPGTDPPGLEACARRAEAAAKRFEWGAGAQELALCIEQASLPETKRDLRWRRARLLFDGYLESEARTEYEALVREFPDHPQSHNRLAWYLLTTSEYRTQESLESDRKRALAAAESAVSLSGRTDPRILDTLAEAYVQNGRRSEALLVMNEIVAVTKSPIQPSRLEQFTGGKTRFMLTHEFSALYQAGAAWNPSLEALSDAASGRPLTVGEVVELGPVQRSALRNSIFARRGQRLGVHWLDDLFGPKSWYRPRTDFDWNRDMTGLDKANIGLIKEIEAGRTLTPGDPTATSVTRPVGPSGGEVYGLLPVDNVAADPVDPSDEDAPASNSPAATESRDSNAGYKRKIAKVLEALGVVAGQCKYRHPDVSGVVRVAMTISADGSIAAAQSQPPFRGSLVGACVESWVRASRFPPFEGPPKTIEVRFSVGDGHAASPRGGDTNLPAQLEKTQILEVVRAEASKIGHCSELHPESIGRTVMVSMTIANDGGVQSATAVAPVAGTPVGYCVEREVKRFAFPRFSGEKMTINMPFAL